MGQAIFITGTDTGVGKTFVTCGLAALLKSHGYKVGVMKPAETGCELRDGGLYAEDAERLRQASGCAEPLEKICPNRFAEPLAPSIAAERAGKTIDLERLLDLFYEIKQAHDVTLVEGAGGLMVPLLPSYTFADFARVAKLPVVVVAANKLGAINHLLLTLEHAGCRELTVLGYVLNNVFNDASLAAETNRQVLAGMTGVACLGELPFLGRGESVSAATVDLFEAALELRNIELVLGRV